jgi:hypothetical protein
MQAGPRQSSVLRLGFGVLRALHHPNIPAPTSDVLARMLERQLPKVLLERSSQALRLEWVDFYR